MGLSKGGPADDAGDILGGLPLAELDGVRSKVDGMSAQSVKTLRSDIAKFGVSFTLGNNRRFARYDIAVELFRSGMAVI